MNGIIRALFAIPRGYIKLIFTKICHPKKIKFGKLPRIDSLTELSFQGKVIIGDKINIRKNSIIRCRKNATLVIGNNVSFGPNNILVSLDEIEIGNNCEFGPNVMFFDHDHDFRVEGGINKNQYRKSKIIIGNNVWIGANSVILRGTTIGDNCVIGAGSVVKGHFMNDSIIVQKRETTSNCYKRTDV